MFDCSKDLDAYHDDRVTLRQTDRTNMKQRRDANRTRLQNGLKKNDEPAPDEHISQGSYEMKTMVQHPDNDYDIDDGVYFTKDALVGKQGGDKSALDARKMVRDAVDDGSFKKDPEVKTNCVRVYYDLGYHVDIPVYRKVSETDFFGQEIEYCELASSSWTRSDARDVTRWFSSENTSQSPDSKRGRQLRRITREIKKYSKSRKSWESQILSGFGITKLVTECFYGDADREDKSFYYTTKAIRDRLTYNLVVDHPVTPNTTITTGTDDPKSRFLREKLTDAINNLAPLFEHDCDREKALKCWDKVFNTEFFSERKTSTNKAKSANVSAAAGSSFGLFSESRRSEISGVAVQKKGGGRYG